MTHTMALSAEAQGHRGVAELGENMTRSKHFDFDCDAVDTAALEGWNVLGIEMKEPQGCPIYWPGDDGELYKELGSITVHPDGNIRLWPYERLLPVEMDLLRGAGMEAFQHPPSELTGWTRKQKQSGVRYWYCAVSFPVNPDDPIGKAVRAAEDQLTAAKCHLLREEERIS